MSSLAIKVENLSKIYRIGQKESIHDTFGGMLISWLKSPVNNYRRLNRLSKFNLEEDSNDIIWALKDINFEVKQGEVLGIIGRNGAGKSTLLKILSQITEPTTGKVEIYGRVASLLEVGTGFNPELTGRENIYLNGTILGMTRREINAKLDEIIDFSGVEKFLDTAVKRYSSGMRVRLAFAVAAHLEPEILIVDEVLAVGDAEFQKKCLGKMQDVSTKEGRTVLFVSHNMDAVQSLCANSILLKDGLLHNSGPSNEIIEYYLDENKENYSNDLNNISEKGIIQEVELLADGIKKNKFTSGENFSFITRYNSKYIIKNPVLGFVILNSKSVPLLGVNNIHYLQPLFNNSEMTSIKVNLNTLLLSEGDYTLNIWLGDGIVEYDWVKGKIRFTVERNSEIFNTTLPPNKNLNSIFYRDIHWELIPYSNFS